MSGPGDGTGPTGTGMADCNHAASKSTGARFCSQCGTALREGEVPSGPDAAATVGSSIPSGRKQWTRRVIGVVAVVLVVVLGAVFAVDARKGPSEGETVTEVADAHQTVLGCRITPIRLRVVGSTDVVDPSCTYSAAIVRYCGLQPGDFRVPTTRKGRPDLGSFNSEGDLEVTYPVLAPGARPVTFRSDLGMGGTVLDCGDRQYAFSEAEYSQLWDPGSPEDLPTPQLLPSPTPTSMETVEAIPEATTPTATPTTVTPTPVVALRDDRYGLGDEISRQWTMLATGPAYARASEASTPKQCVDTAEERIDNYIYTWQHVSSYSTAEGVLATYGNTAVSAALLDVLKHPGRSLADACRRALAPEADATSATPATAGDAGRPGGLDVGSLKSAILADVEPTWGVVLRQGRVTCTSGGRTALEDLAPGQGIGCTIYDGDDWVGFVSVTVTSKDPYYNYRFAE